MVKNDLNIKEGLCVHRCQHLSAREDVACKEKIPLSLFPCDRLDQRNDHCLHIN